MHVVAFRIHQRVSSMSSDTRVTAQFPAETSADGAFVRQRYRFRDRITADGSSGYRAEPGRYRQYVLPACPWAHRTIIVRRLLGLEDVVTEADIRLFTTLVRSTPCTSVTSSATSGAGRLHTRQREHVMEDVVRVREIDDGTAVNGDDVRLELLIPLRDGCTGRANAIGHRGALDVQHDVVHLLGVPGRRACARPGSA